MKGIGLTGAGLGAAGLIAPNFHDLDGLAAATGGIPGRPFWVKEVDVPTTPIDWSVYRRNDSGKNITMSFGHLAPEEKIKLNSEYNDNLIANAKADKPGYGKRELALLKALTNLTRTQQEPNATFLGDTRHLKYVEPFTPKALGYPKWDGNPADNAKMMRTFLRLIGGSTIGYVSVDEKTRNFITTSCLANPYTKVDFENCEEPRVEKSGSLSRYVVPEKYTTAIVFSIRQPMMPTQYSPTHIAAAISEKWCHEPDTHVQYTMAFLKALGYGGVSGGAGGIFLFPAWGVYAGLGELGRVTSVITPEYGPLVRVTRVVLTDLPIETTQPIDFGARNFCRSCGKCAEFCPNSAITTAREPSWEITPKKTQYYQPERFNQAGLETWYLDHQACWVGWKMDGNDECCNCQATCVFSKLPFASVHEIVKGTLATTTVFNSFFTKMDKLFGYDLRNSVDEPFWNLENKVVGYVQ